MRPMIRRLLPVGGVAAILAGVAVYLVLDPREAALPLTEFHVGLLVIAEPFTLATEPGAKKAAGYMRIENAGGEGDRLLSGTASVAESVAIEETNVAGGMNSVTQLAGGLEIPANGSVQLRPGSYRLVFQGLSRQLKEGDYFSGKLAFEKAGSVDVTYQVGPYVASIGGPFALIEADGKAFSNADLAGKPYAIFFGYTHCPDVCPTTLFEMSQALAKLGPDAERVNMVFVSVDPARDTPEFLEEYLTAFDARIVGLTGTEETIANAAKAFHVFYQKVPADNGDYTMDHSATVILMDAAGKFVGTISYGEDTDQMLAKLRRLIAGASS
jgi:protein SCO1